MLNYLLSEDQDLHKSTDWLSLAALQQFEECTALIDKVLADSSGRCEYALHVKALIARQRGERLVFVY
jgi:hypothetical protein